MRRTSVISVVLLLLLWATNSLAQTATPRIDAREKRQQARIRQGVKSGQLTPGETKRLEAREGKLKSDEAAAKADGKVTPAERRKLTREENRDSRAIYRMKHNKKKVPPPQQ